MDDDRKTAQVPIQRHGVIGNMRALALVADTGSIDFMCWPEFDSPSLFTALLDTPAAGVFELAPRLPDARRLQIYLPGSNVLQTRWLSRDAVVEVIDLMPVVADAGLPPLLVRRVTVAHGQATIRMRCRVRHDYNRAATHLQGSDQGVVFSAEGQPEVRLRASVPMRLNEDSAVAEFELQAGETAEFIFGNADDARVLPDLAPHLLAETLAFWRHWLRKNNYRGRWRESVERSALVLKLLTSREHGGILAAGTFGLPERAGGERNWDYRYCWIRDASFTVYAFMRLGFNDEANDFMRWVRARVSSCCKDPAPLRIVYGIAGEKEFPEQNLDHLTGHLGSRPVRIGNQAYEQKQLDIFGELLDAVYLANKYGEAISHEGWENCQVLVNRLCEQWQDTDVGIWEMRGQPQHFLHSRLMCWVALDRAIRLAYKRSLPAPFERWDETRQAIHRDIWTNFWDDEAGHFVQRLGSTDVDAAMLLMPLFRFIGATDPRWLATLAVIERDLVRDGMVYRYRNQDGNDGLSGEEGAFTACSFWYVECLARAGRLEKAHLEFEQLLRYANPLGLYAEEFDRNGRHLGNTPQALSHLALISAATFLDRKLSGDSSFWQP
ncbi:glycoside hydrolase family 15 protein [Pseudomonas sp. RIT-PI-S]|uniref:glycoside hydrolase family 15 protein n=1 Tax=Pseudomonas sp. RIT-PI-S TaxID=3035295 RepID=UPI0021D8DA7D|nr:glycoside hydrolase family 15 protein [Pseudomonas sp. RIT-PI-S]